MSTPLSTDYFSGTGHCLNTEERAALQASFPTLCDSQSFQVVQFWGKILGLLKDYYIAVASQDTVLSVRQYFVSTDGLQWVLLPQVTAEETRASLQLRTRFTGDAAFESTVVLPVSGNETESISVTLTEEKRLSALIQQIEQEATLIPRGALYRNALHQLQVNPSFTGLAKGERHLLENYLHYRPTSQSQPSVVSLDSFDISQGLDKDVPRGVWTVQQEQGGLVTLLRHLKWPGFAAYHAVIPHQEPKYGQWYYGTGQWNDQLGFML